MIEAKGTNARVAANVPALLEGTPEDGAIDARAIQAYYAGLVSKASGMRVVVSGEPELVTIEAIRCKPGRRRLYGPRRAPPPEKALR